MVSFVGHALVAVVLYLATCLNLFADVKSSPNLHCLADKFHGQSGQVRRHDIPLKFTGRISFGDLNADGQVEFVVAGPGRLVAYDLCGGVLWDQQASTNWKYSKHKYWYLTSYGYVGDLDLDGIGEFVHIGEDWKTLYVRNGRTGEIKHELKLPNQKWMYVLLGRRDGETGGQASRLFVVTPAFNQDIHISAYDFRSGQPEREWTFHVPHSMAGNYAYVTPQAADIDDQGGDELLFAGLALDQSGQPLWLYNTSALSAGGMHMLSVRDINPELTGLETVISIYGPHRGKPSLVSFAYENRDQENWRSYSPHKERHPHQHTIGDFDPDIPGLETLARNNNGFNHWMVDRRGNLIRKNWRVNPGWNWRGEYVQAIDWDAEPGSEVLYVERHVGGYSQPRLRIISPITDSAVTPIFTARSNEKSTFLGKQWLGFNPFEAAVHVVDLIGDGREEVLAWGNNKITLFFNSGDTGIGKKWGAADYMQTKKLFCPLYNPR